ncbi:hypothetical protein GCM10010168_64010 [Actinoplanes ianthinogenes]|uniref:Uncharacterized protein n=1 Tax=Actinoplanes ianthinogenes TaxID=122358 RepID=A0ABM7LJD1_9ACTN|nr:hypothetical protein [Actinoplanes ianthinogenes]BCJ39351.1 hypothetical protein Aiant_00080 [Actinoplanes ianthinogenes]GGR36713.1 hypothetical protein GCM10010168_64010 [Actinoplanes ianthinogenes]
MGTARHPPRAGAPGVALGRRVLGVNGPVVTLTLRWGSGAEAWLESVQPDHAHVPAVPLRVRALTGWFENGRGGTDVVGSP